jgi:hypothetical protein
MYLFSLKFSIYSLLVVLCLFSCRSTNRLTIRVAQPAPVYLSSEIKSIGIIDRSLTSEKSNPIGKIEQVLSIETKDLDKKGAETTILALQAELIASGRFTSVKIITIDDLQQKGMDIFPAPIPWTELQKIGDKYEVDAIFTLAFYDTDTRIDYSTGATRVANPLGGNLPLVEHRARVNTLIKNGWRVFDLRQQQLLDEFIINENVVLTGRGINPMRAVKAVMGREDAVLNLSNRIGQQYALRTLPFYTRVGRDYFVRGTRKFKQAKRRAQTGNWDGAAELWRDDVNHRKNKVVGRACYNMAIINEINGDLEAAMEWASRSYADHNNKKALSYLKVLQYRHALNQQLEAEQ